MNTAALASPADSAAAFYDARIEGKLADFVSGNPRVEAAIETLAAWAPKAPRRVLEIGCGVGASTWRMARAWPRAAVIGLDFSAASIEAARDCFDRPNLDFRVGRLADCRLDGPFDLIVMMDVYEHIAPAERPATHAELRRLLAAESRLVLTAPTPRHQAFLKANQRDGLQPVDEDIDLPTLLRLADEADARLLCYREIGVWRYGDYLHAVFGRGLDLRPVARRAARIGAVQKLKDAAKRAMGGPDLTPARDHLGPDPLSTPRHITRRFQVSAGERRRSEAARRLAASGRRA